jgi:hypothetical protein
MTPEKLGSLIGAAFGLVFVLVNTGPLPTALAVALPVIAVVAFVAVLLAVRRPGEATGRPATDGFGRGYWLVVAAEVVGIAAGLVLLNGPLDAPQAAVAWVAFVVGAHFFGLAVIWKQAFFHWLGAAILACGLIGLLLAAAGASDATIDLTAGVLPGGLLLGFGLWGSTR